MKKAMKPVHQDNEPWDEMARREKIVCSVCRKVLTRDEYRLHPRLCPNCDTVINK